MDHGRYEKADHYCRSWVGVFSLTDSRRVVAEFNLLLVKEKSPLSHQLLGQLREDWDALVKKATDHSCKNQRMIQIERAKFHCRHPILLRTSSASIDSSASAKLLEAFGPMPEHGASSSSQSEAEAIPFQEQEARDAFDFLNEYDPSEAKKFGLGT